MKAAVIINRTAGTAAGSDLDAETVGAAFRDAGVEAEVRFVAGAQLADAVRAAAAAGVDVVAVGGGDGTLRTAAAVLVGGPTPLGVLPLGTLNHFAKDLGIPLDLTAAVRLVAAGKVGALDVGEVNGEVFLNTSSLGFYPPVVQERERLRRRSRLRGKWLAAAVAAVKVLPRVPALRIRVEVEGEVIQRVTRFVFVGNNEYSMNLFTLGVRNRLDSGNLYLYIATVRGRLALLGLGLLAVVRDLKATEYFESWSVPEFTIEVRRRRAAVFLDGEVKELAPPLYYRTRVRELRVILPEKEP
jgi:diacylglycerol kinase family enzyme